MGVIILDPARPGGPSDRGIVVGDPLTGRRELTRDEFEKIWRFTGIVLKRE